MRAGLLFIISSCMEFHPIEGRDRVTTREYQRPIGRGPERVSQEPVRDAQNRSITPLHKSENQKTKSIKRFKSYTQRVATANHHTTTPPQASKPTQLDFIHRRLLLLDDRRQRKRLRLLRRAPSQRANMRLHVPMERQRDVLAGRDLAGDVVDLVLRRLVLQVQFRLRRGCDDPIPDDDLVLRLQSQAWSAWPAHVRMGGARTYFLPG